jgi:Flp pilus assembly protein TadD
MHGETMRCLLTLPLLFTLSAGVGFAQAASRTQLLEQMEQMESAGAATTEDKTKRDAYLEILRALGYFDLLAQQYERLTAVAPEDAALWRALGEAWMQAGPVGVAPAFNALKQAVALDDNEVEARSLLAHLLHREGLYDQAQSLYEEILLQNPSHVRAQLGRAVLWARSGKIQEASDTMDRLGASAQEYDVETRLMLRKALHDFEGRGGWFEDLPANHAAYARLLYRAGRIMDAMLAAHRAVALAAADYSTWNFIGAMQLQLGNLEQARHAYDKSLEANADQPAVQESRKQLINELTIRANTKSP